MNAISFILGIAISSTALAIMLGGLVAVFVMLLWNFCFVGPVPGVQEISFFQAWGIYILCNLLFNTSVYKKD